MANVIGTFLPEGMDIEIFIEAVQSIQNTFNVRAIVMQNVYTKVTYVAD